MPDTSQTAAAEMQSAKYLWRPECGLRFREKGGQGMILEQLFIGTSFGQPTLTEWRPVPVVPESADGR